MSELKIKVEAPELVTAILELTNQFAALNYSITHQGAQLDVKSQTLASAQVPAQFQQLANPPPPAQPQQVQTSFPMQTPQVPAAQPAVYPQQPAAVPVTYPQQPMQPQPAAVPVAGAPMYTLDQLSVAGTALVDAGRIADLQALLTKYQIPALTQLPKEYYGAFATDLRAMGAKI
jgi:hypothetical protein